MILTTPREIQVWTYLKASRKRLRAVVEVRCRHDGRLLAAVYPLRDEFWAWHLGERYSPQQWREEAEIMTEETAAAADGDPGRNPTGAPADCSARNFPDAMFQVHDPVGTYKSHTLEQILAAYPSGPFASCPKCRSTYVIDALAVGYATGEYMVNRTGKRNIIYPPRKSYCGDRNHDCGEHLNAERPWNIPGPAGA